MDRMILQSPVNQKLDPLKEDPTAEEAEDAEATIDTIVEEQEEKKDEEDAPAVSSEVRTPVEDAPAVEEEEEEAAVEEEEEEEGAVVEEDGRQECNFDVDPTPLYLFLMQKNWEATINRCKDAPEEVSTWIFRKETTGELRWRLLPIHASVIFGAPAAVVKCFLCNDPSTGMAADDQGMVPLHLAVRMGSSTEVVAALREFAPASMRSKDRKGRTPRDLALRQTGTVRQAMLAALHEVEGPVIEEMDPDELVLPTPKEEEQAEEAPQAVSGSMPEEAASRSVAIQSPKIQIKADPALAAKVHLLELQLERSEQNREKLHSEFLHLVAKNEKLQTEHAQLKVESEQATATYVEAETANKAVISNLVNQVGDLQGKLTATTCEKAEVESQASRAKEAFEEERDELKAKVGELEGDLSTVTTLKDEAETGLQSLQKDNAALQTALDEHVVEVTKLRETVADNEVKLEEVTQSEQELAWKYNSLQETMKKMPDPVALGRQIESLEAEKKELKSTVHKLSVKLYKVVGFLDEMVQEQDAIIAESLTNTDDMSVATEATENDRQKLMTNVSGMKEQIGAVIESVIGNMPDYRMDEEEEEEQS